MLTHTHLPPSTVGVKNARSFTSTPLVFLHYASAHGRIPLFYHVNLELCPFPSNPLVYSSHRIF